MRRAKRLHHRPRRCCRVAAGSRQPAVPDGEAKPALGLGLHLGLRLAGLYVCGLLHRSLRPTHHRLARKQVHDDSLRAGCVGAGVIRAIPAMTTLTHQFDMGSQYVSIRYSEPQAVASIESPVGSRGDNYDNALAETTDGLYKAELINRRAPWKSPESVA